MPIRPRPPPKPIRRSTTSFRSRAARWWRRSPGAGPASSCARPRPSPASMPHARLGARVDAQAEPSIQTSQRAIRGEGAGAAGRAPRVSPRLEFRHARHRPGDSAAREALESQLAAPSAPPELTRPADVTVRVHESMINNVAETVLYGHAAERRHGAADCAGTARTPARPAQARREQEPFTIVFPPDERSGCSRSRSRSAITA